MPFGTYLYNNEVFPTKAAVFDRALQLNDDYPNITFWFDDDKFAAHDWTIEPEKSLDELYAARARRIRDSYNYVILMYSGGSDSHQVLRSFVDNKIFLDEVHTVYPLKLMKPLDSTIYPEGKDLSLLAEYEGAAVPRLRQLAIDSPRTRIHTWDISDFIEANYANERFFSDQTEVLMIMKQYNSLKTTFMMLELRKYIEQHISHLMAKTHNTVAVIYGSDRPWFARINNTLYTYFSDFGRSAPGCFSQPLNYKPILFYWDPEAAPIIIKQGHTFIRALHNNPKLASYFNSNTYSSSIRDSNFMKNLIYPSTFSADVFQQKLKYRDDDILKYFWGEKAVGAIEDIQRNVRSKYDRIKMTSPDNNLVMLSDKRCNIRSRYYRLGEI